MTITLRKPDSPEYLNFSRQVKERARAQSGSDVYDDDERVTARLHYYIIYMDCSVRICAHNIQNEPIVIILVN